MQKSIPKRNYISSIQIIKHATIISMDFSMFLYGLKAAILMSSLHLLLESMIKIGILTIQCMEKSLHYKRKNKNKPCHSHNSRQIYYLNYWNFNNIALHYLGSLIVGITHMDMHYLIWLIKIKIIRNCSQEVLVVTKKIRKHSVERKLKSLKGWIDNFRVKQRKVNWFDLK